MTRLELWAGSVEVGVRWEGRRGCGCRFLEGFRTDNGEYVFHALSCHAHKEHGARAMAAFTSMPPSSDIVYDLWSRLLDEQIEGVTLH